MHRDAASFFAPPPAAGTLLAERMRAVEDEHRSNCAVIVQRLSRDVLPTVTDPQDRASVLAVIDFCTRPRS